SPVQEYPGNRVVSHWRQAMNMRPAEVQFEKKQNQAEVSVPFADVPSGVWRLYVLVWLSLFAVLWWMFGSQRHSAFMLVVSTAFAVIYFAVPLAMLRRFRKRASTITRSSLQTLTGKVAWSEATIQIILIPASITFGLIATALFAL